jgi:hypothetical protein
MLPQVLAGLGALSVVSAGCVLWLQRLQPLFAFVAVAALGYQMWLVWGGNRRRTRTVLAILWSSTAFTALIFAAWVAAALRYR